MTNVRPWGGRGDVELPFGLVEPDVDLFFIFDFF